MTFSKVKFRVIKSSILHQNKNKQKRSNLPSLNNRMNKQIKISHINMKINQNT